MISVTFYLYANSVTVNYIVRVLLMAKLIPLLEGVLIVPPPDRKKAPQGSLRALFSVSEKFILIRRGKVVSLYRS